MSREPTVYACDACGLSTFEEVHEVGGEDTVQLPIGWARITIARKVPNEDYAVAVAEREERVNQRVRAVAEAIKAQGQQLTPAIVAELKQAADAEVDDVDDPEFVVEEDADVVLCPTHVPMLAQLGLEDYAVQAAPVAAPPVQAAPVAPTAPAFAPVVEAPATLPPPPPVSPVPGQG